MKRRRLAAELRQQRERLGLTIEEVAERLEWSTAKVSRIENARVGVLPRDVKYLLNVYGVEGEAREVLMALAREARQKGWWHSYGEAIPTWFEVYVGLESDAATMDQYDTEHVPGLLQTAEYARSLFEAFPIDDGTEIEKRVELRMARTEYLTSDDGPKFWAVLNEAVIRRKVGGSRTMRQQLRHLGEMAKLPNVTLQVLPFEAGAHPAMSGSFTILGFPEPSDPKVVFMETQTGGLYLEKAHEIVRYTLAFDHLRAAALRPSDSQTLIARAADDMT
ncbi:helix-turn-helix domain-containing protein [Actinomadura geliboluensis]|uniref:helix-turn-helix domain-containing protein n=1 Tax=Actinomadura geliboluensis TaxID=882440 RepID=UPI0036B6288A